MDSGTVEMSVTHKNNNGGDIRHYSNDIYPVATLSSSPPPESAIVTSTASPTTTTSSSSSSSGRVSYYFWTMLPLCNTLAVIILGVLVVYIFLQLQYVNYQISQQAERLDTLVQQVTTQQSSQIEQLNQKVEDNHSLTLYQMAGTFGLLTWMITIFHMTTHMRNWNVAIVQRKICTILWMPPIYGTTAFLSLVFPHANEYLSIISDFYEAYVIYTFLSFLIAVLGRGNRQVVVNVLAQHHASHLQSPTKCLSSCYHPSPTSSSYAKANAVLLECQVLCMQFVFLRPLTSIAHFVITTISVIHEQQQQQQVSGVTGTRSMMTNEYYDNSTYITDDDDIGDDNPITTAISSIMGSSNSSSNGSDDNNDDDQWSYFKSPNFYIAMITNVSVFFAFSGLLKFYHAVNQELQWLNPFQKFMAIKGIVFLTFWQGLAIAVFVQLHHQKQQDASKVMGTTSTSSSSSSSSSSKSIDEQAMEIQNVLLCLEMLVFSIAHWCVFPAEEWEPQYHERRLQELEEEQDENNNLNSTLDPNGPNNASRRSRARRRRGGGAPSMGLGDFASDVGYILSSRRRKRRQQRLSQQDVDDDDETNNGGYNTDANGTTLKAKSSDMYITENSDDDDDDHDRTDEVVDFTIDEEEDAITHATTTSASTTTIASSSPAVEKGPSHQDNDHMEII